MSSRRNPVSTVAAVLLTVAVSLLGVRLFLPGVVTACAPAGSACCCQDSSDSPGTPEPGGCGCTVSPATPVPAAALAAIEGVPAPVLLAVAAHVAEAPVRVAPSTGACPIPRARSAPTQALLETFRI